MLDHFDGVFYGLCRDVERIAKIHGFVLAFVLLDSGFQRIHFADNLKISCLASRVNR